jgi:hypothetical protein
MHLKLMSKKFCFTYSNPRWWYYTMDQYFYNFKKQVWYVCGKIMVFMFLIEQLFDMTFSFLGCYEVDQKIMLENFILHNECLGNDPTVWNLHLVPQL